jgi:hypothetical protein
MAENRLRWIVRRVWVTDDHGTKRRGTMWSVYGDSVKIRVDHVPGVPCCRLRRAESVGISSKVKTRRRPVAPLPLVYRPYYGCG